METGRPLRPPSLVADLELQTEPPKKTTSKPASAPNARPAAKPGANCSSSRDRDGRVFSYCCPHGRLLAWGHRETRALGGISPVALSRPRTGGKRGFSVLSLPRQQGLRREAVPPRPEHARSSQTRSEPRSPRGRRPPAGAGPGHVCPVHLRVLSARGGHGGLRWPLLHDPPGCVQVLQVRATPSRPRGLTVTLQPWQVPESSSAGRGGDREGPGAARCCVCRRGSIARRGHACKPQGRQRREQGWTRARISVTAVKERVPPTWGDTSRRHNVSLCDDSEGIDPAIVK